MTTTQTNAASHAVAAWPEQLSFPGQTAAHPGPVDMMMMYVMHHGFRRDLTAFAAAASATPPEDRTTWRALAARWELFAEVLHHHHSGEDAGLWPTLLERADEAERAVLVAMEAEHAEIDPILTACAAGFERLAHHADEDARAALAVRLSAARESLGRHLRHEETEAIAIIQRVLTNEEWEQVEVEHFRKDVPFSRVLAIVPWAAHDVPGPLRRQVFAKTGRPNHLLWLLTRRGFERRERLAFRYLDRD
ncbi:Hemerythrin HHE cation binding domain-containing protein [Pedococcus dokdonensis]|uniref:Hemerythrin HHE cation binding domain-containing protein n=1 Tax=Pedococcus dokdonensis TaxID=443156 RepID=A0A1H0TMT1_9MICO|nr:hemerythrin domain-containing protein [Pedococcus dokdonensis]SDP55273.1 Hemerythrin HHE cation binding domain-containing protein [Pedococcus dokdonensis]